MTWRIGMATGGCVDRPITDVIDDLAGAGFRAIEIGTPPKHFDPWHRPQVDAVAGRLRRYGMAVISIHAPFGGILDLSDPNAHHRAAAMGGILQAASVLRDLGGGLVVVHPTDAPRHGNDVGQRLQASGDALAVLSRSLSGIGLRLAVESPLPHLIGGHPEEFAWILGRVDGQAGVCLDTSHTWLGSG
jgi:sugar phosphate isomerase/epimerase